MLFLQDYTFFSGIPDRSVLICFLNFAQNFYCHLWRYRYTMTAIFGSLPTGRCILLDLASILNSHTDPAILMDTERRILGANRPYVTLYGNVDASGKRHCYEVSHNFAVPCDQAGESCPLQACLEMKSPQKVMHVHHTPRGKEHVAVEIRPVQDNSGKNNFFLEIIQPVKMASAIPSAVGLVGNSPIFNQMLEQMHRVGRSQITVLLLGESGTGKEIVARTIHDASSRAGKPFVPVECSGLTETLFESEMFGHERGSFTGAVANKIGLVEAANGGTLFLDEIGDVPLSLQIKLLRLLETHIYRNVGGVETKHADFRLICATHRNLEEMIEKGEFRLDLYYRICAFPIVIPSLRDRLADLPILIKSLLNRIDIDTQIAISEDAIKCLSNHTFPGNIRELYNILERANLLADGPEILPQHLPEKVKCSRNVTQPSIRFDLNAIIPIREVERRYLNHILACFPCDKNSLSEKLGISQRTLFRKLQMIKQNR